MGLERTHVVFETVTASRVAFLASSRLLDCPQQTRTHNLATMSPSRYTCLLSHLTKSTCLANQSPANRRRGVLRYALSNRNYRFFFGGQSVSLIGTWMTRIATSWLVYRLTGSGLTGTDRLCRADSHVHSRPRRRRLGGPLGSSPHSRRHPDPFHVAVVRARWTGAGRSHHHRRHRVA